MMKTNITKLLLSDILAFSLFTIAAFCQSSIASDFQSPRTAALGGAGHAGPLLNDAIYLNSAYSAFLPTYSISGNFAYANFQDDSYKYKIQNASILDGRSEMFQAGVSYTKRDDGNFIHIGTGKAIIPQRLSVGVGGKAFSSASDSTHSRVFDASVSATAVVSQSIQTSVTADNLIQSSRATQYGLNREITLGSKFNISQIVIVYLDPHYAPSLSANTLGYEAGAEWPMFSDLFLRAGIFRHSTLPALGNTARGNGYALGLGFLGPRISLDWGLSRIQAPTVGTSQVVGFTIFM